MIRAAITCPIPGTVVSSFSVAVLMSILPSGCLLLNATCRIGAVCVGGLGVDETKAKLQAFQVLGLLLNRND